MQKELQGLPTALCLKSTKVLPRLSIILTSWIPVKVNIGKWAKLVEVGQEVDKEAGGGEERPEVGCAYLYTRQCYCRVSVRAAGRCTVCCTTRRRRSVFCSASPRHTWPNTRSTQTTPHPTEDPLRGRSEGWGWGQGWGRVWRKG